MSRSNPAGHQGPVGRVKLATQCVVPRSASKAVMLLLVLSAVSIRSRKSGLYRPRTTSGRNHHAQAAAVQAVHHAASRTRPGSGARVSSHSTGTTRTASVTVPFTPPSPSTPHADSAAARRGPSRSHASSGSRIHGSAVTASASADSPPSVVSIRGHSA